MKVTRPEPGELLVSKRRGAASAGVAIWASLIAVFYYVVVGAGPEIGVSTADGLGDAGAGAAKYWILLLFPVFLIPYVVESLRVATFGDTVAFSQDSRVISRNRRTIAAFDEIDRLELRSVNGRCEDIALSAVLVDGREISILGGGTVTEGGALAADIARMLDVEVVHRS